MKTASIIGAGIGGLAAAVRLAKKGYAVTVYEANEFVGGKINSKNMEGYRFDMGPSVFTCPNYVKELYDLCEVDFSDFQYTKLPESFTYFYADGTNFTLPADKRALIETLHNELGETKESLEKYLKKAEKNYGLIAPLFIESSLHRWSHLMKGELFSALAHLPSYKLYSTMHEENSKFFQNKNTIQLFNRFASYNGSSPFEAPAMLNMISHLELNEGVFLPKEGMVQIPQKVKELADKLGVQFEFNSYVDEIIVENQKATGIRIKDKIVRSDVVFSNMDIAFTYEKLIPKEWHPEKILKQEKSSSAVVFYLGIKKSFENLGVHNIFFSKDYEAEYKAIFHEKTIHEDPTIYLNITSKHVPSDAPEGCENWFLMINAPINVGQNWEEYTGRLRKLMVEKVSRVLGEDINNLIEVESFMNPVLIEDWYSGKQGSIYGNASNNKFATFYRHANFSKKIDGLYFVGVTVHPGGGIPLALNSAKIAVRCMEEDLKRG